MLTALALNCTLNPSPTGSSTQTMIDEVLAALKQHDVVGDSIRVIDHDVRPGVQPDMGDGDEWPALRSRILDSDILVFATPTWVGHPSSIAQRVLERLDAEISETDDEGRPLMVGKVAVAAVVGNEDGAHKIAADLFQALNDTGFTVPAQGSVYWNGEAMSGNDYKDLDDTPEPVVATTATLAANAAHLARLLNEHQYPA
ncbi:NAD(P)H-dependent oxidoreductase [Pseudonocardia sp. RS11V-5]|uniref:flavodoxin family protein n=1 Tax=Pseudonocardia terrae TaxID=2905831 RepID=UPI001E3076FB|nr:NAD(P)H-dependent oxidoreductase [Pseudonocardia terrae]MCE3553115.1 NAD(P)H-dependent oxidoreductase [Pseudonocardia terrae]